MDNAQKIWDKLISAGPTPAGAAGLMGNLYAESGLNPENLQNTCEAKLGFTDAGYTVAVDNGCYTNFVNDGAGYGLAQWTYQTRKAALLAFGRAKGVSIGDLDMQVRYLLLELWSLFQPLHDKLCTTSSIQEASDTVLLDFERPASVNDAKKLQEAKDRRAAYAQMFYDSAMTASSGHAELNCAQPLDVAVAQSIDKFTKEGSALKLLKCILTESDCYKAGQTIKPKGVMVHSTGANNPNLRRYVQPVGWTPDVDNLRIQLGPNTNGNHWNQPRVYVYTDGSRTVGHRDYSKKLDQVLYEPCVHAFIGRLADGSVAAVQTLPWEHRGWHCGTGSKGTANDTHISFEMCEDALTDPVYFQQVYQTAVELTAMLCQRYDLDPLADGVVICHQDGYKRGIASNHGDVYNWFPGHGKTMDDFRADVVRVMNNNTEEEENMPVYKTLKDVPEHFRPTIQKLMEDGSLVGEKDPNPTRLDDNIINVSYDYCRIMTTLDRRGKLD